MNELLWIAFALLDLGAALVVYRLFGRVGLFGMVVFSLILCNIQVLKVVELFGMTTTLGNILYASVFLATDILSEMFGPREARRAVVFGFIALVLTVVYMQLALAFTPAPDDFAQPSFEVIFGFLPRVAAGSLAAYLLSQLHDIWAFHFIRNKTGGRHLWLRNTASTAVSQALDTLIFCFIALYGAFPDDVFWEIVLTTYVMKFLVAVLDTPFMYLARRIRPAQDGPDSA